MTAPRAREQCRPPSPPDRLPPRRGGGSSPSTCTASPAGRAAGPARAPVARHGLARSARALAAAALLALSGALALPPSAQAQTVTTLVSNIGQGVTGQTNVSDRSISQRFDTGDNGNGYTLTGVDLVSESSDAFAAQVCETDSICDRTAKIQEVILAELSGVTECAAVTVANLASITTFGVNGFGTFSQGITSLKAGDFGGLTALTILDLSRNQLASLPDGIFSGLTAVTRIYVNQNQLTALPEGGLALAVKGDTRFTRTASEATKDADGGDLEAATADVWLLRLGIEGSRRFALGGDAAGMVLTPSFELGARLDGGDAETGLGMDLGGGLAFVVPKRGVALDLKARGLIAHEAPGFREWGASASLTWDPRPTTDRGLALRLRQGWGGSPTGGMDALLGRETLAGLAADPGSGAGAGDNGGAASAGRLEAELGYGIALFGGGFTGTPNLGVGLSDAGRDYRLGWRLTSARRGGPGFEIGLDATRREAANADAEHGVMLRGTIRW